MSKRKQEQSKFSIWWNRPRLSRELVRDVLLIFLGICFSVLMQPNQGIQAFLYVFVPPEWRLPMGLIIIALVVVFLFIWLHRLDSKDEDAKTKKLIEDTVRQTIKAFKEDKEEERKEGIKRP